MAHAWFQQGEQHMTNYCDSKIMIYSLLGFILFLK